MVVGGSLPPATAPASESPEDPDNDADDERNDDRPENGLSVIEFTSGLAVLVGLLYPGRLGRRQDQPHNDSQNDKPQDGPRKIATISALLVMAATITM